MSEPHLGDSCSRHIERSDDCIDIWRILIAFGIDFLGRDVVVLCG